MDPVQVVIESNGYLGCIPGCLDTAGPVSSGLAVECDGTSTGISVHDVV